MKPMTKKEKCNGFPVLTLDGKEITQSAHDKLPEWEQAKVVRKINGPHHDAKWARDIAGKGGAK